MTNPLFSSFECGSLSTANRIVMAPMTRGFCPGGVPGPDVAEYYARRARGGVGLVITEAAWIDYPAAKHMENAPDFFGDEALAGWKAVVDAVHEAGGRIFVQLWHVGVMRTMTRKPGDRDLLIVSPSGVTAAAEVVGRPMTEAAIADLIDAFAQGVERAQRLGFDGVELHGAHGYLLDQFMSPETNRRSDRYGGNYHKRGVMSAELIRACRRRVGAEFPISYRFSQWKLWNYEACNAETPEQLQQLLTPMADAGVSLIHCSTRRFWEPAFPGSELTLAGWVKQLTAKPTIICGSVGLNEDFMAGFQQHRRVAFETSGVADLGELQARFENREFDLVAVGRQLLSDPEWTAKIRENRYDELRSYDPAALAALR